MINDGALKIIINLFNLHQSHFKVIIKLKKYNWRPLDGEKTRPRENVG